ncbi:hypothetical protein AB0M44_19740 [Streptosporangium subroseum]|uniref:hypothetical protein n=1 Tax=Streptosporangium subroseum TaxID=106412 RepID=UPI003433C849
MVTFLVFMAVVLTTVGALRWSGEVHPHRIAVFSRRQALVVTPAAEPIVRDYLRITRMWRSAGLVAGIAFPGVGFSGLVSFAFTPLDAFIGWFLGVIGAELVLARRYGSGPGATTDRLPALTSPPATWFLYAGVTLGGGILLLGAVDLVLGGPRPGQLWLGFGGLVPICALLLVRSLRRRPIPVASAEVVAAVLATRSRSAHVLAIGCAVFALDILWPDSFPPPSGSLLADLLLSAAAVAALVVGTHPWAITVTAPAPTPP